ncbi:hypothetical protein V502_02624 [Pseudogymnoascus sp. VKM F-4520 (FW-2644)]|nr:hypothetical protein V502_02624 [Pseudogymnoascus sp. VKM F-4520 (FW-2644)]
MVRGGQTEGGDLIIGRATDASASVPDQIARSEDGGVAHDADEAEVTIGKVMEADAQDEFLVIMAHDRPSHRSSRVIQDARVAPLVRKRRLSVAADGYESSDEFDIGRRHIRRRTGIPRASDQDNPEACQRRSLHSPVSSTSLQSYRYTNSSASEEKESTADVTVATAVEKIKSRVARWKRGEEHSPVSAEESESSIDWDQPNITPREGYGSFPFWARHDARIEAKIEKTRKTICIFRQASLTSGSAPEHSWITSIRGKTKTIRMADEAAYKARDKMRSLEIEQIKQKAFSGDPTGESEEEDSETDANLRPPKRRKVLNAIAG